MPIVSRLTFPSILPTAICSRLFAPLSIRQLFPIISSHCAKLHKGHERLTRSTPSLVAAGFWRKPRLPPSQLLDALEVQLSRG